MPYCIYLRKSRADMEAEARGEGETLARHRATLLGLAARLGLSVDRIYEEIVSGDTIAARPQMRALLGDMRAGMWEGVLCMEIERLARGDSIDQGIVAQAFRCAGTRVITPYKTYDPRNDMDEEFFEFNLFMARREYKAITRRMQAGRVASVREGHYCGSRNPFGYTRIKATNGGWTLEVEPAQAGIVEMIFALAAYGDGTLPPLGATAIANRLNGMGVSTNRGGLWSQTSVSALIRNPLYMGYVTWNKRKSVRTLDESGNRATVRVRSESPVIAPGLHPPIVSREVFELARRNIAARAAPPVKANHAIVNPFSGLVRCAVCGRMLRYTRGGAGLCILRCKTFACPTSGISVGNMEALVLDALHKWLGSVDAEQGVELRAGDVSAENLPTAETAPLTATAQAQLDALRNRRDRLCELLEQGVYDTATYARRSAGLDERIERLSAELAGMNARAIAPSRIEEMAGMAARVKYVCQAYALSDSPAYRNRLLKSVLSRIAYSKTEHASRSKPPLTLVTLEIYPRAASFKY